jgi:predicted rRNA methylase YqxC with S4 and FtsJ domains
MVEGGKTPRLQEQLGGSGLARGNADREAVLQDLRALIETKTPWTVRAEMRSPIEGAKGNVEFLLSIGCPAGTA